MEIKMHKFPDIEQFRNAIYNVKYRAQYAGKDENGDPIQDETLPLPILNYRGTVKLHGTNGGVSYDNIRGLNVQSRENIITPQKDNAGFATFVYSKRMVWVDLIKQLAKEYDVDLDSNTIIVFCEWVGKGIQSKVGISKMDKSVFIFSNAKVVPFDENMSPYWVKTKIS
jgi:hypothetical protein